jgi:hypothetical protein
VKRRDRSSARGVVPSGGVDLVLVVIALELNDQEKPARWPPCVRCNSPTTAQRLRLAALAGALTLLIAAGRLAPASAANAPHEPWPAPAWAVTAFEKAGVHLEFSPSARYILTYHVNPMILFGDFDGDHRTDVAVLVRDPKTGKVGIAVARQAGGVDVLGGGVAFGNGGDDFRWLDRWYTFTRGPVEPGADQAAPPTLTGDAIWVEKGEAASAVVYFTGKAFAWYQQGD